MTASGRAPGQRRDVVAAPDVELAPVHASGRRDARVEGGGDAVAREPGLARDPQPEQAAAADHEKVHQGMLAGSLGSFTSVNCPMSCSRTGLAA